MLLRTTLDPVELLISSAQRPFEAMSIGVVEDRHTGRARRAVDLEAGDPGGVVVVEEVVPDDRALNPVEIDRRASRRSVVPRDVVLDHRAGDEAVAPLREIGIQLDPAARVVVDPVSTDDRPVARVGDIDAVLGAARVALVVLEKQIIGEIREDPPGGVVAEDAVADRHMVRLVDSDGGSVGVERRQAIDRRHRKKTIYVLCPGCPSGRSSAERSRPIPGLGS